MFYVSLIFMRGKRSLETFSVGLSCRKSKVVSCDYLTSIELVDISVIVAYVCLCYAVEEDELFI